MPPPVVQPCPEGKVRDKADRCVCPPNLILKKGVCVSPPVVQPCADGMVRGKGGRCVCPQGQVMSKGICRPPVVIDCAPGFVLKGGACVPVRPSCKPGERFVNGACMPLINPGILCKKGSVMKDGRCVPIRVQPVEPPQQPQDDAPPVLRQPPVKLIAPGIMKIAPQTDAPQ